jgi:hypothetical protein
VQIIVRNHIVRFNKYVTWWLVVWMNAHLTLKKYHHQCMKKVRVAEQFRSLTGMYGVIPA